MKSLVHFFLFSSFAVSMLIFFSSCHNKTAEKPSVKMELPDTSKTHQPDLMYEVKKKAADELMLNKLENGADSFELRLWAKVEVLNEGQVFVIKKINNQWNCLHYSYLEKSGVMPMNPNDLVKWATDFTIDTFWVNKKHPAANWDGFFKDIEKENIYNLPSQADIKGWKNSVSDGFTYYVEYATKDKYKFYWYNCPDVYENKFKECRQMTNILSVFNREFGLKMGFPEENRFRCMPVK